MNPSPNTASARLEYLRAVTKLLWEVFQDPRYVDAYTSWLYEQCPDGREISADLTEGDSVIAHYAVVPRRYRDGGNSLLFGLSLNTAVSEAARGKGAFTRLAEEAYRKAAAEHDIRAIIGVANANSSHGFLNKLAFRHVCPLPVVVGATLPRRGGDDMSVELGAVDEVALRGLTTDIEWSTAGSECQPSWDFQRLAWRLNGTASRYSVHSTSAGVVIATGTRQKGIPFAAILKFFPRRGRELRSGSLVAQACAHYRTPFFVYGGIRKNVRIRGLPLPQRLRPSPLNLIYRKLAEPAPEAADLRLDAFEFLDFDAY